LNFYWAVFSPKRNDSSFLTTKRESNMKKTLGTLAGIALIVLSGQVFADEATDIGKKIYERAFGRGCGTCHDIASNPQLTALIKAGSLDRAKFEAVLKEGKGGMPKAIEEIMKNAAVVKAGYGEDQAVDALYNYLSGK
jgi:mono/diheme cytochrome c family protein